MGERRGGWERGEAAVALETTGDLGRQPPLLGTVVRLLNLRGVAEQQQRQSGQLPPCIPLPRGIYFSQNTSVGVRGYAADRYAKSKDTGYKKVISDNGLQLHSRSAVMETYGAFSKDLWSLVTVLTDPASHPHASGDYDPWCRPEPRRDFFLSLAFAAQRGGSKMLREAGKRRRDRRAAGRYATGTRA